MPFCISEAIAWSDFLQTSGKWPPPLAMPPNWPPIPRAQVLQAFLLRMARHNGSHPTRLAMRKVYKTAFQPPPDFSAFIGDRCGGRPGARDETAWVECTGVMNPLQQHRSAAKFQAV